MKQIVLAMTGFAIHDMRLFTYDAGVKMQNAAHSDASTKLTSPFWATLSSVLLHGLVVMAALIAFRYGWLFVQQEDVIDTQAQAQSANGSGMVDQDPWDEQNQSRGLSATETPAEQIMTYLFQAADLHRHMTAQERAVAVEERLNRLDAIPADRLQSISDRVIRAIGVRETIRMHPAAVDPDRVHYRLTVDGQFYVSEPSRPEGEQADTPSQAMQYDSSSTVQIDIRREITPSGREVYVFVMVDKHGTLLEIERDDQSMTAGDLARFRMYELARHSPNLQTLLQASTIAAMEIEDRRNEAERQLLGRE